MRTPRPFAGSAAAAVAALAAGCSSDASITEAEILETQLRNALAAAGVAIPTRPPVVSDELYELGRALFFDKLLSGNQDVACSTCHLAAFASADGRTLPLGTGGAGVGPARVGGPILARNAPALLNAHALQRLFYDGRIEAAPGGALETPAGAHLTPAMEAVFVPGLERLAAQAMIKVEARDAMRGQVGENELGDVADGEYTALWDAIAARLVAIPAYVTLFQAAYPGILTGDIGMEHAANAIAAFEARAFGHADSALSRFLANDPAPMTLEQIRGGLQFFGAAGCAGCHTGTYFTDDSFHDVGMPQFGPGLGDGLGGDDDFGRERVTGDPADRYRFRTPALLNVELTAPYGHTGQFSTLESMVAHFRDVTASLNAYDVMDHVTEPGLVGTVVGNQADVLANLDPLVAGPATFNVQWVAAFLRAMTADGARDLSALVPPSVPSGLGID